MYTVQFVKHLQTLYPQAKLLFIWDGASYHQYADMQAYLQDVNQGLEKHEWKVTCELFAPNAPEQNPVEDIWLKGKNFLRKYFYKLTTFAKTKHAFLHFLQTTTFDFPCPFMGHSIHTTCALCEGRPRLFHVSFRRNASLT